MNAILESIVSSNLKELPCVFCSRVSGQLFSVTELKKHLQKCTYSHTLKLYGCHFCDSAFASRDALTRHQCSSFSQFMGALSIANIREANFQQEYSSLICSKCGLQINLKLLDNALDDYQMESVARQFQDSLLAHSSQDFILCTVYMFDVKKPFVQNHFLKLSFIADNSDFASFFIEDKQDNSKLSVYIQEAYRVQQHQNRDARSVNSNINNGISPVGSVRFNAQSQFERIELDQGNCKYECKVCGHLTKMNIKPSALSQHFKDRHPEFRAQRQSALSYSNGKKLSVPVNSLSNLDLSVSNYSHDETGQVLANRLILDKDINDLNNQSDILLEKNWTEYQAYIQITSSSDNTIIDSSRRVGLLDDDVYSCQLCNFLSVGPESAEMHFTSTHTSNLFQFNSIFDVHNPEQVRPVFRFSSLPCQGIVCFVCLDSSYCSLLSLCSHLAMAHNRQFSCDWNKQVDAFEIAAEVRKILCQSKTANESAFIEMISNDFLENNLQMFDLKQEHGLDPLQDEIVEPLNQSHPIVKMSEMFGSGDFLENENNGDSSQSASTSSQVLNTSVKHYLPTTLSSAIKNRRLEMLKNRKYKSCKFNAQEHFQVLLSEDDPSSRRFKCIVCGHVTKPNVSPNTLSQHFGDKHPEMRAMVNNAMNNTNMSLKPRSKRNSSRINKRNISFLRNIVPVTPRLKESPTSIPATCSTAVSTPLADDIVFGSFLNNNNLEEFERLARSNTVFPYFEIVIKNDGEMPTKLLNALSHVIVKTVSNKEKQQQIVDFAGELLKRSRTNSICPIKSMSLLVQTQLSNAKSGTDTMAANFEGIFTILDELLHKCGY